MTPDHPLPRPELDQQAALRTILEGTATETGERFFAALVRTLAEALGTHGAWVTEYHPDTRRLRALAFWMDRRWVSDYEIDIRGTPCEAVIERAQLVHIPDNLLGLFPEDAEIEETGAVSYMGVPLKDVDGGILGHMAVVDRRPMPEQPQALALFQIFAARAAAELQRLRAEAEVREREEKLGRLVDSAMDAILELDGHLLLTRMNPAAEQIFGSPAQATVGQSFGQFLTEASRDRLTRLIAELDGRPDGRRYLWIPGGLEAVARGGRPFSAEATLARFDVRGQVYHSLILRNVNERLEAERRIRSLANEAEYLREEIKAFHNFEEILGQSDALRRTRQTIATVAATDATVLILGETGTGKELVARAVHAAGRRRDRPFIKVNCGAISTTLIESEFFGHEAGAFTGALHKREGRFSLADGGTILLDEIGELPLEVQVKLLRVLQEGEFEPVGSSRTRKVDVRVLAATNRDLEGAVRDGRFREDLYYRINVFPLRVPPLRERGSDVLLLAAVFAERIARRLGRTLAPLSRDDQRRLQAYEWPGNIRELQNVIERAVITAVGDRINLAEALPGHPTEPAPVAVSRPVNAPQMETGASRLWTAQELLDLERGNLIRALELTGWRVSGEKGAAQLIGINPSTLASRMKALGIKRPTTVTSST